MSRIPKKDFCVESWKVEVIAGDVGFLAGTV